MLLVLLLVILILLSHLKIILMHKRISSLYEIISDRDKDILVYNVDSDVMEIFQRLTHDDRLKAFTVMVQFEDLLKDEYFAYAWKSFHSSSLNDRTSSFRRVLEHLDADRSKLLKSCLLQVLEKPVVSEALKPEALKTAALKPEDLKPEAPKPEDQTIRDVETEDVKTDQEPKRHEITFEETLPEPEKKPKRRTKKNKA